MSKTVYGDWGSLVLHRQSSTAYRLFVCSTIEATAVYNLTWTSALPAPATTYVGEALPAQKGAFSSINPAIFRFALEAPGRVKPQSMAHIDLTMPYTITPIPETNSVCIGGTPPPTCNFTDCKLQPPNPFTAALLGDAHWPDPTDPTRKEFFFSGGHTVRRVYDSGSGNDCDCSNLLDDCTEPVTGTPGPWTPCGHNPPVHWAPAELTTADPFIEVGWNLVNLTLSPATSSIRGSDMNMSWRQYAAPRGSLDNAANDDYVSAVLDDRTYTDTNGLKHPTIVYGSRGGADKGLKPIRTQLLPSATADACSTASGAGGFGEAITPLPVLDAFTHFELEDPSACDLGLVCGQLNGPRQLYNNQMEFFRVPTPTGQIQRAVAVAAGFINVRQQPATPQNPTPPTCDWATLDERPMLVIFNVTETGRPRSSSLSPPPPAVWRIALGYGQGNAFCVKTQRYTSQEGVDALYAFVGDGTGRLIVFDISELHTVPPATLPYYGNNHFLIPVCPDLVFPKDPYDGHAANVTDLALDTDTNYLYCALSRAGVGIVDVSNPSSPTLVAVIDTPGLALGVTIRKLESGDKVLVVGDSRCGLRVYQ